MLQLNGATVQKQCSTVRIGAADNGAVHKKQCPCSETVPSHWNRKILDYRKKWHAVGSDSDDVGYCEPPTEPPTDGPATLAVAQTHGRLVNAYRQILCVVKVV